MSALTDDDIVRRVAIAIEENSGECNWKSRRQTAAIARAAIAKMKAIEAEQAELGRSIWCATEGTYD